MGGGGNDFSVRCGGSESNILAQYVPIIRFAYILDLLYWGPSLTIQISCKKERYADRMINELIDE